MLQLIGMTKSYGELSVLQNFNLEIAEGEIVGVVGKSGCGKTTLLRILAGVEGDYAGDVLWNGVSMKEWEPCKRNMAMVYQEPVLWNHMTVQENIEFSLSKKVLRMKRVLLEEIVENLEIDNLLQRYPHEISGGQAKRVSLARALISGKEIFLLDEPLSNIDEHTQIKVLGYLKKFLDGRKTVLYVSHDMKEVEQISHRWISLT